MFINRVEVKRLKSAHAIVLIDQHSAGHCKIQCDRKDRKQFFHFAIKIIRKARFSKLIFIKGSSPLLINKTPINSEAEDQPGHYISRNGNVVVCKSAVFSESVQVFDAEKSFEGPDAKMNIKINFRGPVADANTVLCKKMSC